MTLTLRIAVPEPTPIRRSPLRALLTGLLSIYGLIAIGVLLVALACWLVTGVPSPALLAIAALACAFALGAALLRRLDG